MSALLQIGGKHFFYELTWVGTGQVSSIENAQSISLSIKTFLL